MLRLGRWERSCRLPSPFHSRQGFWLRRFAMRGFAVPCDSVEPAARTALSFGHGRILPATFEQACLLHPFERPVEGAVRRPEAVTRPLLHLPGQLVAVEFGPTLAEQGEAHVQDEQFERDECTRLASHDRVIGTYVLFVKYPLPRTPPTSLPIYNVRFAH